MKKTSVSFSFVQFSIVWGDSIKNIEKLDQLLSGYKRGDTDCIVLPEMFPTGFTMTPEVHAEPCDGPALNWMKEKSKSLDCCFCGGICVSENGQFYNRLYWVTPEGLVLQYDKRHLFRMAGENQHYSAGTEKIYPVIKGWRVLPLICYDLRFPIWSRNRWKKNDDVWEGEYDVLLYIANWPESRKYAWKQLLLARAIENQSFVIGVNRIGIDGNNIRHAGESFAVNPLGEFLHRSTKEKEEVFKITLEPDFLAELRSKFPVGMDADSFTISEEEPHAK